MGKLKLLLLILFIVVATVAAVIYYKGDDRHILSKDKATLNNIKFKEANDEEPPQVTENDSITEENLPNSEEKIDDNVLNDIKDDNIKIQKLEDNADNLEEKYKLIQPPKLIQKDPYFFNITADIPSLLDTDEPMDQTKFYKFIKHEDNKKLFCNYSLRANKIYNIINNENRVYQRYRVKNLISEHSCLKTTEWSEYDLFQLYMAIYNDYIRTNVEELDVDTLKKIYKAKEIRIRNYFNIIEDFPGFLSDNTILSKESFGQQVNNPKNSELYCRYYSNFIKAYNANSSDKISVTTTENCKKNILSEQTYEDYLALYQYLSPSKYKFKDTILDKINEIRKYRLIIEKENS